MHGHLLIVLTCFHLVTLDPSRGDPPTAGRNLLRCEECGSRRKVGEVHALNATQLAYLAGATADPGDPCPYVGAVDSPVHRAWRLGQAAAASGEDVLAAIVADHSAAPVGVHPG